MHYYKGCVVLFITLVNTFQIHGILEINFPASNVGNYGDSTHMNCTDSTFDVTNGYSWYKDAVIIYSSSTGDTGRYKSTHGSNYFTLEITDTDLTDNGVYQCSYNFQDISDTLEIQAKGKGAGKVENGKLEITFTGFYPVTTTVSSVTCNGKTITGSPTSTTTTGNFLTVIWTSSNNVDPSDLEAGCDATISSRTTYSIDVSVKEDCTCECKCKCRRIVIASIVIGIIGAIILPIVIGGTVKGFFDKEIALAVDILGFVCGVISFALGIVVQREDCCKNDPDCCENSDCCQDECKKNWIEHTALGFIIFGCLVGIVAGVIFFLVWSGKIRRGRNGITKKDLRPSKETVCEKLLRVLESAYPRILLVKDLIRKVDAEESVVMEQLEELKRKDLIRQLDSGGFVRHFLDVKTGITKQDLRPLEEIVCEKLLHVLESVHPNILSVKDLIRIDFAVESVVMEQLEELRRKDLIRQLDSGGFVRHFLDVQTAYKAEEAKEPGENDRMMETSN